MRKSHQYDENPRETYRDPFPPEDHTPIGHHVDFFELFFIFHIELPCFSGRPHELPGRHQLKIIGQVGSIKGAAHVLLGIIGAPFHHIGPKAGADRSEDPQNQSNRMRDIGIRSGKRIRSAGIISLAIVVIIIDPQGLTEIKRYPPAVSVADIINIVAIRKRDIPNIEHSQIDPSQPQLRIRVGHEAGETRLPLPGEA